MKHLINRRSLSLFLVGSAILIALTAFLVSYTDGEVNLLSPFLIVPMAGLAALVLETRMQRRAK